MSKVTDTREQRRLLVFPSPSTFVGFVLTFLDEHELGPDSEVYQESLNRIFVPRKGRQTLYTAVRGDEALIQQLTYMAIANGGESREFQPLDSAKCHVLSISHLLRAVKLQPVTVDGAKLDHVLLAMWGTEERNLTEFLRYVWDLGISDIEVAFVDNRRKSTPRHFVRLFGIRHPDAFYAWCRGLEIKVELYVPARSDRRGNRFYSLWGYRHPVPGLDLLAELDRELVLLRPRAKGDSSVTEWITFGADEVNFFRKAYQFAELELSLEEVPLIELQEDHSPASTPIELAIVQKPKSGPNRIWQLDKQIDRQRRALQELEQLRGRLAAGEQDEVFFAYRFDQQGEGELNPRLIRLMQQRLGTLVHYEYAFCQPKRGNSYHLVIANRSQRQMGFSLQPADRVYYQPASWRRWGLNLFLPLHAELAPRVDSNDALSLLQKVLERSDQLGDISNQTESVLENAAILWESGRDGEILETRVRETRPLLAQFHLLNSFQRKTASRVARATREKLAEGIQEARHRVGEELDGLTRDLLEHVGQRTDKLEASYSQLEKALQAAEKLVGAAEPRVEEVKKLILDLPNQWTEFVNRVVEIHRSIADPQIQELVGLRNTLRIGRSGLRALAVRGRDLSDTAQKHRDHLSKELAGCDEAILETKNVDEDLKGLSERAGRVFAEVSGMHNRLKKRIQTVRAMMQKADKMQKEIDEVGGREADVKLRIEKLEPLHAEYQERAVEVDDLEKETARSEQALLRKSVELAQRRQEFKEHCLQIASQLEQIEAYLQTDAQRAEHLENASTLLQEQLELVEAHQAAVAMWEQQEKSWEEFIGSQRDDATKRMDGVKQRLNELENTDRVSKAARDHVGQAHQHLLEAETLVHGKKK